MRILAIDYGEKRIGLAVSDPAGRVSSRLKTLRGGDTAQVLPALEQIIVAEKIEKILIGVPLGLKGETEQTRRAQAFASQVQGHFSLPVETINEVLSSKMAAANLRSTGLFSTAQIRALLDQEAARIFLEDYLRNV